MMANIAPINYINLCDYTSGFDETVSLNGKYIFWGRKKTMHYINSMVVVY